MSTTPGTWRAGWARCARALGLDHNPLRRTVDRVETGVRLAALVLLLTAVPAAVLLAGRTADHVFLRERACPAGNGPPCHRDPHAERRDVRGG